MRTRKEVRTFVGDFETTVYEGQTETEVWASACVEMGSEDVKIFHSIAEQWQYFISLDSDLIIYYHNLKFDGSFWLDFIMRTLKYKPALDPLSEAPMFVKSSKMPAKSYKYLIADMGQWYTMEVRIDGHNIKFVDSMKLLPFKVSDIGRAFKTKHQKLDMEYVGKRYAGCVITPEEQEYIANDVLVVKEALEIMFSQGHEKLTIGGCCLEEFKNIIGSWKYKLLFPDVYDMNIDSIYGALTVGDYIRKSYRGGWCYMVPEKKGLHYNGTTADVNSLYPSVMHSESGSRYPVGEPKFWSGSEIPTKAKDILHYYFVRIRTRFYLKDGYLPFIQIKGNALYPSTESLKTSDVYDAETKKHYRAYRWRDGTIREAKVEMTLTQTDFELIQEHYRLEDLEILDGCYFLAKVGLFDEYINKYRKIKMESKGAMRTLAKLFLNNLYGKMATNTDSSFKLATMVGEDIHLYSVRENNKKGGYIPCGSAITSYARAFTIRAAQKNYHGIDKPGFIYADTDSIHCDLPPEEIKGINVDDVAFCCWKLESCWDKAQFVRQKTYMEHVVKENLQPCDEHWEVRCAGLPGRSKELFLSSMLGRNEAETEEILNSKLSQHEKDFIAVPRNVEDFDIGINIPGKLMPKRIKGGILLVNTDFRMR